MQYGVVWRKIGVKMVHESDWWNDVFVWRNEKLLFTGSAIYGEELSDVVADIQVSVIFDGIFGLDKSKIY